VVEFLGRRDLQVKVGGHRIELGEVEVALGSFPGVGSVVAVVLGRPAGRLGAVVVPAHNDNGGGGAGNSDDNGGGGLSVVGLLAHCRSLLPGYMVPQVVQVWAGGGLPLTANGKVDRPALVAVLEGLDAEQTPDTTSSGVVVAPSGPIEVALARLWSELLQHTPISRGDNFFTLGGDSLLATRLVEGIRRDLAAPMSLRLLLTAPTFGQLAELVSEQARDADPSLAEEGVV
jgi:aryl carrier-like protein